jgi:type IV secretion system protein VirB6
MGFFAEFSAWLNSLLATYIGDQTARVAAALEPAIVALAAIYLMVWGYLQLTGKIEEPFATGLKRILTLVVVLAVALRLWLYNTVVVDTFFNAPGQLAAVIVGAYDAVTVVDRIIFLGGDAGALLMQKGGILEGSISYDLAGIAVYLLVGLTAIYTIFLLALSRIALSVLLALGPLFFALLLFESTKHYFMSWLGQLANYALITLLAVLAAALMMTLVTAAAQAAANQGGGIQIADAARVCMAAGLTFLVMRQVMPIAAALSHGVALQSYSVVSRAISAGARRGLTLGDRGLRLAAKAYQANTAPRELPLRVPRP